MWSQPIQSVGEFLRELDRRSLFFVLGVLLLGISGFIILLDRPLNWINSPVIIVLTACGLFLIIMGWLTTAPVDERQSSLLTRWGMIDLRKFDHEGRMGRLLGECESEVIVLKTWFPEDEEIAKGLESAVQKRANIQLILCNPNSPILGQRSISTRHTREIASGWIYHGLRVISENVLNENFSGVFLYDAWPGCPVIWADGQIFMGFYFWGHTSPNLPWVEVKASSALAGILKAQREEIIKRRDTVKLDTLDDLRGWMKENPPPQQQAEEQGA